MFAYCTQVLHLSEFEAYLRITVARAARQHPVLLERLREGSLHLTAVAKLAPHLTRENCETVLRPGRAPDQARGRGADRRVGAAAGRANRGAKAARPRYRHRAACPLSDRTRTESCSARRGLGLDRVEPPALKRSPSGAPERRATERSRRYAAIDRGGSMLADTRDSGRCGARPWQPPSVEPLSPARYKVQFTASAAFRDKLERLAALMRSSVPDGDLAAIIEQAVTEKLERLEARRFAKTKRPEEGPLRQRLVAFHAPRPGRGPAGRLRAGRRPVPLRRRAGSTLHRARRARVPPSAPIRPRRRALRWRTSRSRAKATTATWPRSTTAGRPWHGTGAKGQAGRFRIRPGPRYPSTDPPDPGSREPAVSVEAPGWAEARRVSCR